MNDLQNRMKQAWALLVGLFVFSGLGAQNVGGSSSTLSGKENTDRLNTITTAVPFLMIAPDSRSGAMGNTGVSLSPDANSIHWNPSKLAFAENEMEFSVSYVPWLRELVSDIDLGYLSGYKRIDDQQAMGASLRYFSLGNITFTDNRGNKIRVFKPREFAVDVVYSRLLTERLSGGIAVRYIHSDLTGGTNVSGASSKPGRSVAADVSAFYTNDEVKVGGKDATFNAGINISNIGSKMAYTNTAEKDFIPINLRLGPTLNIDLDEYNQFAVSFDLNKLLVPTPPIYDDENTGGEPTIIAGEDPNVGVAAGMFGSFSDAPGTPVRDEDNNIVMNDDGTAQVQDGSVAREEFREINFSGGFEYWYDQQFAVRGGYFFEHPTKGNRQFFTLGAGLQYNIFSLDFSYLIPTSQRNPLANTLRFTLRFNFEDLSSDSNNEGDS